MSVMTNLSPLLKGELTFGKYLPKESSFTLSQVRTILSTE